MTRFSPQFLLHRVSYGFVNISRTKFICHLTKHLKKIKKKQSINIHHLPCNLFAGNGEVSYHEFVVYWTKVSRLCRIAF